MRLPISNNRAKLSLFLQALDAFAINMHAFSIKVVLCVATSNEVFGLFLEYRP